MKTVVFLREFNYGGRLCRAGELLRMEDVDANRLAAEGVVEIRRPRSEATETK